MKKVARIVVPLAIVGIIFFGVLPQFIEPESLAEAYEQLTPLEWLVLIVLALARMPLVGWQHRSALRGLTLRRATQGYLASAAVSNTIPGPSGMATRYGMYRSWGFPNEDTALAIFISGLPTTIVSLVLPILAVAILAVFGGVSTGTVILALVGLAAAAAGIAIGAYALRSDAVAVNVGRRADAIVARVRRRAGREPSRSFAEELPAFRLNAQRLVGDRWGSLMLAGVAIRLSEFVLLVLCLRFVGIGQGDLPAALIFVVYAIMGIITLIQITPGAAGIAELGYTGLLSLTLDGAFNDEVAAAVFLFRGATWLLPILLGAPLVLAWRRTLRREESPAAT